MLTAILSTYDMFSSETGNKSMQVLLAEPSTYDNFQICQMLTAQPSTFDIPLFPRIQNFKIQTSANMSIVDGIAVHS